MNHTVLYLIKKKGLALLLVVAISLVGCGMEKRSNDGVDKPPKDYSEPKETIQDEDNQERLQEQESTQEQESQPEIAQELTGRKFLTDAGTNDSIPDYVPSVADYQVESDLSNVDNADRYYLQEHMNNKLSQNLFVVIDSSYNEFFNLYEQNRYMQMPSFITVDSMLHTYHLYFAKLLKNTEQEYLIDSVKEMSIEMLEKSKEQYEELKSSEWEDAAKINVAFFATGAILAGEVIEMPEYAEDITEAELKMINDAGKIEISPLNGELEDYTQYKPRGYYEGKEDLEQYFRAMMWYGRRNFVQKDETMDRCALLMTIALEDNALVQWEKVYSITSFFAGASDDSGAYEYLMLIKQAYGEDIAISDLIDNTEAFETYHKLTGELDPPQINSVVFPDDGGTTDKTEEAKGYRFMGQRFTLDAAIFTQLCYSKVKENPDGDKRLLPDSLDIPAALGSETALDLLEENGQFEYQGYLENMNKTKEQIAAAPDILWHASLYGEWLYTLKPLLTQKGTGYPSFMQNNEWSKKNLESFLSSFTELKHDTVLYSKQFMAEMGGGDMEFDDRGYVEPEVEVYARLSTLTQNTSEGLQKFGVINASDIENLSRLSELADRLKDISIKELTGAEITEEDYELIRTYGGNIEHFWAEAVKDENADNTGGSVVPAALVVDVATDPNGSVLEQAIGGVSTILVVVPIDDKLMIAKGAVFSYYQFTHPISDRLTDSQWRRMIGLELNDDMEYEQEEGIEQPDWTQSYRTDWKYDEE